MTPNGQRQRAHRERRTAERERMIAALEAIAAKTASAQKEMGMTVNALAWEGLGRAAAKGGAK